MNREHDSKIKGDDFKIPANLSELGNVAVRTILDCAVQQFGDIGGGGCRAFYSPKEWAARGETYGHNSELVVVHDGGDLAPFFNYDYERYELTEEMHNALKKRGLYAEPCTCWYTAIYRM